MQAMAQACQSSAIHPQGKWNMPAVSIRPMDTRATHRMRHLFSTPDWGRSAKIQSFSQTESGLEWRDPIMQAMAQACQSSAIHPQGKWNMPAVNIRPMDRATHHEAPLLHA